MKTVALLDRISVRVDEYHFSVLRLIALGSIHHFLRTKRVNVMFQLIYRSFWNIATIISLFGDPCLILVLKGFPLNSRSGGIDDSFATISGKKERRSRTALKNLQLTD